MKISDTSCDFIIKFLAAYSFIAIFLFSFDLSGFDPKDKFINFRVIVGCVCTLYFFFFAVYLVNPCSVLKAIKKYF